MHLLKQLMELNVGDNRTIVDLLNRLFSRWEVKFTFNGHPVERGLNRDSVVTVDEIMSTMVKFRDRYTAGLDKAHKFRYPRNRIVLRDPEASLTLVLSFNFSEKEQQSRKYDAGIVTVYHGPVEDFRNDPGHKNAATELYV